jgi:hypothetical protein
MDEAARLWVLSPVYLDVESYLVLQQRILAVVPGLGFKPERVRFVAVDDSAGFDPQIARLQGVLVHTPPFNLGHQRAIVFGLRSLRRELRDEDVVVTLDADGEDQPEDLPRLLAPLLAAPADLRRVALALRTRRRESLGFKLLYAAFKLLFVALTGTVIRTGNFAAYRGWTARRVLFHPHFDLCYSSSLLSMNRPLELVPCERGVRYAGQSRMGFLKLTMHGIRMLMPFVDRIAIRALVAFTCAFVFGIALAAWVVGVRIFTHLAIPGWATYTLLLVLLLSFVAIGNFVILFALFSQSQGVSLGFLDREDRKEDGDA